jgi:hypothetical protein
MFSAHPGWIDIFPLNVSGKRCKKTEHENVSEISDEASTGISGRIPPVALQGSGGIYPSPDLKTNPTLERIFRFCGMLGNGNTTD